MIFIYSSSFCNLINNNMNSLFLLIEFEMKMFYYTIIYSGQMLSEDCDMTIVPISA